MITVSIVSHKHLKYCKKILGQLVKIKSVNKIILTINIYEKINFKLDKKIILIKNKKPAGFSTNHNNAFKQCKTRYFCVLNPDISIIKDPFKKLLREINEKCPLVAPQIIDKNYILEDNARYFPTPTSIIMKLFFNYKGIYKIKKNNKKQYPDWVAGMFMLFSSKIFKKIKGFDESFFLYYEDVDICCRLHKLNKKILIDTNIKVIHDARRTSRTNFKFFFYHLKSMITYFIKHLGRHPVKR